MKKYIIQKLSSGIYIYKVVDVYKDGDFLFVPIGITHILHSEITNSGFMVGNSFYIRGINVFYYEEIPSLEELIKL